MYVVVGATVYMVVSGYNAWLLGATVLDWWVLQCQVGI